MLALAIVIIIGVAIIEPFIKVFEYLLIFTGHAANLLIQWLLDCNHRVKNLKEKQRLAKLREEYRNKYR